MHVEDAQLTALSGFLENNDYPASKALKKLVRGSRLGRLEVRGRNRPSTVLRNSDDKRRTPRESITFSAAATSAALGRAKRFTSRLVCAPPSSPRSYGEPINTIADAHISIAENGWKWRWRGCRRALPATAVIAPGRL